MAGSNVSACCCRYENILSKELSNREKPELKVRQTQKRIKLLFFIRSVFVYSVCRL
jgi:hypothetical protein